MAAWENACAYRGSSTLLIPEGNFFVGEVSFSGPCFDDLSPKVLILGTLIAPTTLTADVWIRFDSLHHLTLTGGDKPTILDGQGADTWSYGSDCRQRLTCDMFTFCENLHLSTFLSSTSPIKTPKVSAFLYMHLTQVFCEQSLKLTDVSNGTVSNISLVNSKGFHMAILGCDNIHLSGFNITAPWDSQNTDGIHISQSTNINITASDIGVGDDCISIGQLRVCSKSTMQLSPAL